MYNPIRRSQDYNSQSYILREDTDRGHLYIGGLVQDYSNSSALVMELLQSCTGPLM